MARYTSVADVRTGCPELDTARMSDLTVSALIIDAELDVESDLSPIASQSELRALAPIPNTLVRLAAYLSRHRAYLIHHGDVGGTAGQTMDYWDERYKATLASTLAGGMSVTSNSGSAITVSMNKGSEDKEIVYTTDGEGLCLP